MIKKPSRHYVLERVTGPEAARGLAEGGIERDVLRPLGHPVSDGGVLEFLEGVDVGEVGVLDFLKSDQGVHLATPSTIVLHQPSYASKMH